MTCTRPDLAYPLSILARYVAPGRHRPKHMAAAKRVLRYLCSTSGMGLVLGGRRPVVLTGHADASWADDQATQRSSQGYTFSLGSGSVSWRSTRSSSVLSSSCEAEIYAGAMAAQELRWLTYLLTDLGEQPRSPPVLYVDNKAMLALCREHRLEHRTKHIALRYFLARELQQRGQLRLAYVASEANTADIFTKALAPGDHQRLCTLLVCFALLDWSCDPLFSPTLPMGAVHVALVISACSGTLSFKQAREEPYTRRNCFRFKPRIFRLSPSRTLHPSVHPSNHDASVHQRSQNASRCQRAPKRLVFWQPKRAREPSDAQHPEQQPIRSKPIDAQRAGAEQWRRDGGARAPELRRQKGASEGGGGGRKDGAAEAAVGRVARAGAAAVGKQQPAAGAVHERGEGPCDVSSPLREPGSSLLSGALRDSCATLAPAPPIPPASSSHRFPLHRVRALSDSGSVTSVETSKPLQAAADEERTSQEEERGEGRGAERGRDAGGKVEREKAPNQAKAEVAGQQEKETDKEEKKEEEGKKEEKAERGEEEEGDDPEVEAGFKMSRVCDRLVDVFWVEKPEPAQWRLLLAFSAEWARIRPHFFARAKLRAREFEEQGKPDKAAELYRLARRLKEVRDECCWGNG
ncbi:unnamed protein product [Closterium sp. NIES-53]